MCRIITVGKAQIKQEMTSLSQPGTPDAASRIVDDQSGVPTSWYNGNITGTANSVAYGPLELYLNGQF